MKATKCDCYDQVDILEMICVNDSSHSCIFTRTDSNEITYLKQVVRNRGRSLLVSTFPPPILLLFISLPQLRNKMVQ